MSRYWKNFAIIGRAATALALVFLSVNCVVAADWPMPTPEPPMPAPTPIPEPPLPPIDPVPGAPDDLPVETPPTPVDFEPPPVDTTVPPILNPAPGTGQPPQPIDETVIDPAPTQETPEPATIGMALVGLGVLGARRRRSR